MDTVIDPSITAAAYIRVSDSRQDEYSPDSQLKLIKQYAQKNNLLIPEEYIFYDDGISGSKAAKRPEFIKMIGLAKDSSSPFKTILVWKFSRFARNQEESIVYKKMLKKNGIQVISISEPISEDPFGSLIERIIEWMDEYYLIRLSPEVRRGMTEKVSRGEPVCQAPIGYLYDPQLKKYIPDPKTAPLIRQIFSDFNSGISMVKISRQLNATGHRTKQGKLFDNRSIEYILNNPVYIGTLRWSKEGRKASARIYDAETNIYFNNAHEPIITEEEFNTAKTKLKDLKNRNRTARTGAESEYMLKGIIKCSCCGSNLNYNGREGLQCWKYVRATCPESHYISIKKANSEVTAALQNYATNDNLTINIEHKNPVSDVDQTALYKQIRDAKAKLQRLTAAYLEGIYTLEDLKPFKQKIEEEISICEEQIRKANTNTSINPNEFRKTIAEALTVLTNPNTTEAAKNELLRSFIKEIIFDRKNSTLTINFFY